MDGSSRTFRFKNLRSQLEHILATYLSATNSIAMKAAIHLVLVLIPSISLAQFVPFEKHKIIKTIQFEPSKITVEDEELTLQNSWQISVDPLFFCLLDSATILMKANADTILISYFKNPLLNPNNIKKLIYVYKEFFLDYHSRTIINYPDWIEMITPKLIRNRLEDYFKRMRNLNDIITDEETIHLSVTVNKIQRTFILSDRLQNTYQPNLVHIFPVIKDGKVVDINFIIVPDHLEGNENSKYLDEFDLNYKLDPKISERIDQTMKIIFPKK